MKSLLTVSKFALALAALLPALSSQAQLNANYVPTLNLSTGTGTAGATGDGGPATAATLNTPYTSVFDANGNLFIDDEFNNTIRRVDAVTGNITTVAGIAGMMGKPSGNATAGNPPGSNGDGGPATAALLNSPTGVAVDGSGNLYIADAGDCAVREVVAATGIINTVAGAGVGTQSTAARPVTTCTAASASLTFATGVSPVSVPIGPLLGITTDSAGNVIYTASTRIFRLVTSTNLLYAFYCKGTNGKNISGDGGQGTAAACGTPVGVTLDAQGNLYFADTANSVVRKVTASTGIITEVAGTFDNAAGSTTPTPIVGNTGDGGQGTAATLNGPRGVFVDAAGSVLYIASSTASSVRVVNLATGVINTLAGTGVAGATGNGGPSAAALVNNPYGVSGTPAGDKIAITDTKNNQVRVSSIGNLFPATLVTATSATQNINAQAMQAGTSTSFGIAAAYPEFSVGANTGCPGAVAAGGYCSASVSFAPALPGLRTAPLVLADSAGGKAIIGLSGIGLAAGANFVPGNLSTFAGSGLPGATGNGAAATAATLNQPTGVALDALGNAYIADTLNNQIRLVSAANGNISVFAGSGAQGFAGDGAAATAAQLNGPKGVTVDPAGNVYIADTGNNRIREVSAATGFISTVAGGTTAGSTGDGGAAAAALLNGPQDIAASPAGNIYIADTGNNEIREIIVATGAINTVAGTPTAGVSPDGTVATAAMFTAPAGIGIDSNGILYISDTGNNQVRKVVGGALVTVAGTGTQGSTGDGGAATAATLNTPGHLAIDAGGDVFIAGTGSQKIREVSFVGGIINTVAGTGTAGVSPNGTLATNANLSSPTAVATDPTGNLYIVSSAANTVLKDTTSNVAVTFGSQARSSTSAPVTISLQNFGNQPLSIASLVFSSNNFAQTTGAATDCAAAGTLAGGATCQLRITFTPRSGGPITGTLTVTDNALAKAGSTQVLNLSGIGVVTPTTIAIQAGNQQTAAPLGAFAIPLKVLVTDAANAAANGVNATFTASATAATGMFANGTNTVTIVTGADGTASANLLAGPTRGTFTVTVTVPGVATPAVFTETIAGNVAPTITLTVPTTTLTYGQSATITATLSPSTSNGASPSGTINFFSNGVAVGSGMVTNASASTTFVPNAGTNAITATYTGDANFNASQTVNPSSFTVNPLAITAATTSVTLPYGTAIPVITGTLTGVLAKDTANVAVTYKPNTTLATPDVGTYALVPSLSGSAAANYTVTTTGSPTLTITQAATVTKLTATPTQVFQGSPVTITVSVASTVAGGPTPTGNLTFFSGTGSIGTAALKNGTATLSTSTLLPGALSITATYMGSNDYLTSTSAATTVTVTGPDFVLSIDNATYTMPQGGRVYPTLTIAPNQIFAANVTFSCPGIPATFSCTFTPTVVSGAGSTVVTIASSGPDTSATLIQPKQKSTFSFAYLFFPALVLLGGLSRSLRKHPRLRLLARLCLLLVGISIASAVSGCGSGAAGTTTSPLGTSMVTISATGAGATHTTTVTLTITPATPLQ